MQTPSPTYVCPRCRASFENPSKFCGRCGATMDAEHGHEPASVSLAETERALTTSEEEATETPARPVPQRRASDTSDRWLGRIVDDRYQVLEIVGRGGMGVVYKVEHLRMGKIAAMKVLHHEYYRDPEIVERFRREAEAISRLTHPNTVQVFDFGTAHEAMYLIMEYVRGPDLSTLIQRDGPLSFARTAPILAQICAALSEAHSLGIVHRDLKPENILVTRTQRGRDFAKILDFGLAKLGEREENAAVTGRGSIIGTPYYMSPEQVRGEEVDARTDIYALGSIMYRMLTGEHAFPARTPVGVLTKHLTAELIPPSRRAPDQNIPPVLDDIVARAMAKSRDQRYATIGVMLDDIESAFSLLHGESGTSGPAALELPETASWTKPEPAGPARPLVRDESDDVDYGIASAIRLRRSDLDEFERSLRVRRKIRVTLVPLLFLALVALAAYVLVVRPQAPRRAEHEPNNHLDEATIIAPETPVTGYLGQRISKRESDRDYYRVLALPKPAAAPASSAGTARSFVVTAHVTALPNIDIALSLFDPTGKLLAQVSEGTVGQDEWIRRLRVASPVYALVTEAMPEGLHLPTENVSDAYALTLTFEPVVDERESEPNNGPSDALSLAPARAVSGHLDQRLDVDTYRFAGDTGSYRLTISGAADVPLTWQIGAGVPGTAREALVEIQRGDLVQLRRGDAQLAPDLILPGADQAYTLTIAPPQ